MADFLCFSLVTRYSKQMIAAATFQKKVNFTKIRIYQDQSND